MIRGTLLAFDFGERRIGVAIGETSTRIASPLTTVTGASAKARLEAIAKIVREWQPVGFVVGRPKHADGSEHPVAAAATKFARRLEGRHGIPVYFVDETLTSAEAESTLRESRTRAKRAGDTDALAAALILQSYLDHPGSVSP